MVVLVVQLRDSLTNVFLSLSTDELKDKGKSSKGWKTRYHKEEKGRKKKYHDEKSEYDGQRVTNERAHGQLITNT